MLFNSIEFLLFFPVVTIIYFLLPHKWRWLHLLAASCIFYMAFIPVYIFILFFTIIIDYLAGIMIENAEGRKRKLFLICSIVANVGMLMFFKYCNFFITNVNAVLHSLHIQANPVPLLKIILPIGLSFHTFQAMSYTIEVYRGRQKAERHFGIYALYVMFYPQLVAGPIERPQNLIHQFHEGKRLDYGNVTGGLKLILWGMVKKIAIADRLALLTDPVFNNPHNYPPVTLCIAVLFFTFQIYCDFSGYSDIAIGAARVMGFKLMKNFNRPYASRSLAEFWTRWHISLSTWFKDYLYISLGGNRVAVPRWFFNLFFVFLVSGFWHGANWTFVVWGALHGFYLIAGIITGKIKEKYAGVTTTDNNGWFKNAINIFITFSLVLVAWVFFRANTLADSFYILRRLPLAFNDLLQIVKTRKLAFMNIWGIREYGTIDSLTLAFSLITGLLILEFLHYKYDLIGFLSRKHIVIRWAAYYSLLMVIYSFGVFEDRQFIYFQF
jgi:alginate O-acetyltransferase complex protein AlgI